MCVIRVALLNMRFFLLFVSARCLMHRAYMQSEYLANNSRLTLSL